MSWPEMRTRVLGSYGVGMLGVWIQGSECWDLRFGVLGFEFRV